MFWIAIAFVILFLFVIWGFSYDRDGRIDWLTLCVRVIHGIIFLYLFGIVYVLIHFITKYW